MKEEKENSDFFLLLESALNSYLDHWTESQNTETIAEKHVS